LVRRLRTQGAEKLNKEINAGLTNSKIKARLVDVGGTALSGSPAIAQDTKQIMPCRQLDDAGRTDGGFRRRRP
jgi:hypothetical protein